MFQASKTYFSYKSSMEDYTDGGEGEGWFQEAKNISLFNMMKLNL